MEVFYRILWLGEDDKFLPRVTVFLKEFMLQDIIEFGKLRVISTFYVNSVPVGTHCFKNGLICTQHFNELRSKILSLEYCILWILFCFLLQLLFNLIVIIALCIKVIDVEVRSNEYTIILEHVNHILIGITEATDTCLKGIERTFQTLYKSVFTDACQTARNQFRIIIKTIWLLREKISNCLITSIRQLLNKGFHWALKHIGNTVIHFVCLHVWCCNLRETLNIFVITRDSLNISTSTTDCYRLDDTVTNLLCQFFLGHSLDPSSTSWTQQLKERRMKSD